MQKNSEKNSDDRNILKGFKRVFVFLQFIYRVWWRTLPCWHGLESGNTFWRNGPTLRSKYFVKLETNLRKSTCCHFLQSEEKNFWSFAFFVKNFLEDIKVSIHISLTLSFSLYLSLSVSHTHSLYASHTLTRFFDQFLPRRVAGPGQKFERKLNKDLCHYCLSHYFYSFLCLSFYLSFFCAYI